MACRRMILGKAADTSPPPRALTLISPLGKLFFPNAGLGKSECLVPCTSGAWMGPPGSRRNFFPSFDIALPNSSGAALNARVCKSERCG